MKIQVNVELEEEMKLRLDIHGKIEKKTQTEMVTEALEGYLPKYFIKLQE